MIHWLIALTVLKVLFQDIAWVEFACQAGTVAPTKFRPVYHVSQFTTLDHTMTALLIRPCRRGLKISNCSAGCSFCCLFRYKIGSMTLQKKSIINSCQHWSVHHTVLVLWKLNTGGRKVNVRGERSDYWTPGCIGWPTFQQDQICIHTNIWRLDDAIWRRRRCWARSLSTGGQRAGCGGSQLSYQDSDSCCVGWNWWQHQPGVYSWDRRAI